MSVSLLHVQKYYKKKTRNYKKKLIKCVGNYKKIYYKKKYINTTKRRYYKKK